MESRDDMGDVELTTGQAARMLRVAPDTLRRWTREGRIACRRTAAGRRFYRVADLIALRDAARASR